MTDIEGAAADAVIVKANQEKLERAAALEPAEGCARYYCRIDCGAGKYRQGEIYSLPGHPSPRLFRMVDAE